MDKPKFKVIDVDGLTPQQLDDEMNALHQQGYYRAFQSSIEWYQGKGFWGVITFELREEN